MKLLVFVDLHGSLSALKSLRSIVKKRNPDLIICLGDLSLFEDGLDYLVKRVANLKKPILMLHGNHESDYIMKKACAPYDNITFLHKKAHRIDNYVFIAWGGGGFSQEDTAFEKFAKKSMKKIKKDDKVILLTHGPPFGTKLDDLYGDHVGCASYTEFIFEHKPLLAVSGHIHETACRKQKIGPTRLSNPGPKGKIFVI
ncbi:hypothetical protein HN587_05300 [Candidatus Woesearchaeota archaeon]|jgi:uncharacterized protein|nr:hypothetical protein [Candidatus Woesearchaeota archaeon]